ncbi:MAG: hypothetical protein GY804_03655 [Alphaproteobacteria bacterium]|nr:hypothetical protein [Alphaproteobacteria bacterium]
MKDYELGRLAEELIEKRYGDILAKHEAWKKQHKAKYDKMEEEREELEESKIYLIKTLVCDSWDTWGRSLNPSYEYVPIDEITKELKEAIDQYTIEKGLHGKTIDNLKSMSIFGFLKWKRENRGEE